MLQTDTPRAISRPSGHQPAWRRGRGPGGRPARGRSSWSQREHLRRRPSGEGARRSVEPSLPTSAPAPPSLTLRRVSTVDPVPDLVTLHLWGVPDRRVPAALLRMARDRRPLRRTPRPAVRASCSAPAPAARSPSGTPTATTGALLGCWDSTAAAAAFESGPVARAWGRIATERLRVDLRPLASRGLVVAAAAVRRPQPRPVVRRSGGRRDPGPDRAAARRDVLALGPAGVRRPAARSTGCGWRSASARRRSGCRAPSASGTPPTRSPRSPTAGRRTSRRSAAPPSSVGTPRSCSPGSRCCTWTARSTGATP